MDGLELWNFATGALKPQTMSVSGTAYYNPNKDPLPILGGLKLAIGYELVPITNGWGTLTWSPAFPRGILAVFLTGFTDPVLPLSAAVFLTPTMAGGPNAANITLGRIPFYAEAMGGGVVNGASVAVNYLVIGW